jgi:hypothetical protein
VNTGEHFISCERFGALSCAADRAISWDSLRLIIMITRASNDHYRAGADPGRRCRSEHVQRLPRFSMPPLFELIPSDTSNTFQTKLIGATLTEKVATSVLMRLVCVDALRCDHVIRSPAPKASRPRFSVCFPPSTRAWTGSPFAYC